MSSQTAAIQSVFPGAKDNFIMEHNLSLEMGAPEIFDGIFDKTWDGGGVPSFETTYISMSCFFGLVLP